MKPNLLIALVLPNFDEWFPTPASDPDTSGDDTDTDTDAIFDSATDDPFEGVDASVYICTFDVLGCDPVSVWGNSHTDIDFR